MDPDATPSTAAPLFPQGPPDWPMADADVLAALERAYQSGSWGRYDGDNGNRLKERLSQLHSGCHAELCSSGTIAVELALRGLKIEPGDEVLLAGYDFSGNFRSIEAVGARPVLVDIDPATWTIDPARVEQAILPRTRAIIASHLHGGLAAMRDLREIADRRDLSLVEDACQAPGALVDGRPAGTWGDAGVFSFGGSKLLTAGRGGAVLTFRDDVRQRIRVHCERGNHAVPLSELQASVLLPQLEKLDARNRRRTENARRLLAATRELEALEPLTNPTGRGYPVYYKLAWRLGGAAQQSREDFLARARREGVAIDSGFRGFLRRPDRVCRKAAPLEHSQAAAERTVILHHPVLLADENAIDRVAAALRLALRAA